MSEDTQTQDQDDTQNGVITIKVSSKKTNRSVTFQRNVGTSLDELVALYGADPVRDMAISEFKVRCQGAARTMMDVVETIEGEDIPKYTTDQAIEAAVSYVPGQSRRRVDAGVSKEKAFNLMAKQLESGEMTLEQLMAEIQRRQSAAA